MEYPISRISQAAAAIIEYNDGRETYYLLQENMKHKKEGEASRFNLVSGHYEAELDEGRIKNTVIREIQEELPGLRYLIDFRVDPVGGDWIKWCEVSLRQDESGRSINKNTLYLFRAYKVQLLFQDRKNSARLFKNPKDAFQGLAGTTREGRRNLWVQAEAIRDILGKPDGFLKSEDHGIIFSTPVKYVMNRYLGGERRYCDLHGVATDHKAYADRAARSGLAAFSITHFDTLEHQEEIFQYVAARYPAIDYIQGLNKTVQYGSKEKMTLNLLCYGFDLTSNQLKYQAENKDSLLEEFVPLVHAVGGIVGLAHPYAYPAWFHEGLPLHLKCLKEIGIDLLECYHPSHLYDSNGRKRDKTPEALMMAEQFDLFPVGGADDSDREDLPHSRKRYSVGDLGVVY